MTSHTSSSLPTEASIWDAFVGPGFADALQDGLSRATLSTRPRAAADHHHSPERATPQVCPGAHGLCRLSPSRGTSTARGC
ncbi:hypothetical protein [Streptomyces sp. NPDC046712]|uniref:hypothetical protein n=1 Tax=Streptomyces sp. NPDC046712 TaxID=3154802 RepID=UPI0033E9AC43